MIMYLLDFFVYIYILIFPGWSGLYSIDRFLYLWSFYHENYKARARRTWHYRGNIDYVQEGEILRIYLWGISWAICTNKCTILWSFFHQKRDLQGICNINDVIVENRECLLDVLIGWQLYPVIQWMFSQKMLINEYRIFFFISHIQFANSTLYVWYSSMDCPFLVSLQF